ncbi:SCO family protein [Comamonas flocculans]|uniref:Cytochrome C oxidase subunit I n=1 Tax=Comamonas flocculans TaxID=2597701 RepID=A0A5B8RTD3_9BURK|nr:hypothetical protein [Comamonas flocculans]QEA11972.1 hypothetical protein FOZ74_02370 [Comamonas flocculans]
MSGSNSSDALAAAAAESTDPVQLTVHSLPGALEARRLPDSRKGRWQLWLMLAVCVAPVLASYFVYYVVRPSGGLLNFGELIEPQRPMPQAQPIQALDGSAGVLGDLRGQWLLLSVADGACDEVCRNNLYFQRQLRESLGEGRDRIDWVWLIMDDAAPPQEIRDALRDATVRRIDAQALQRWLAPSTGHALPEQLYLVDPQGNWMMRFPPQLTIASAERVRKDLSRLLYASAAWDRPGRGEGK